MFLALDLGTTNVKALVTDSDGRPQARGSCHISLFHVGNDGVEQDLAEIWAATLSAIQQATHSVNPARIRAIGVSSQGGALQLLTAASLPQGRVISWLDQRGQRYDEALTGELGREWFLERIGHGRSGLAIGQLLRLRRQSPDLLVAPNRIGFVGDIIVSRLCGRGAQDGTSCGLTLLYNPALRDYDPELRSLLEIRVDQLPALISPREPAGSLLPEIAKATGLTAGIPVSAAVHDQYAAALGTRAVRPGRVLVGAGTAWVLLAVSDRLTEPVIDDAFVCNHLVEGLFGQIVSLVNGGSALTWALELMGLAGTDPAEIERLLESAPAGANGLTFWPFMTPFGASGLARGTKGRLSGLQLSHRPAHVVRAVVEGLAYELNRHLNFLRNAGIRIERLLMSGRAGSSRVTPQILADASGTPLECLSVGEGSLLGAAIIARGLLEGESSLASLAEAMVPAGRLVEPGASATFYQEQYERYLHSLPLVEADPP
jgi:sugar (pentulose or hexulose) kinase